MNEPLFRAWLGLRRALALHDKGKEFWVEANNRIEIYRIKIDQILGWDTSGKKDNDWVIKEVEPLWKS